MIAARCWWAFSIWHLSLGSDSSPPHDAACLADAGRGEAKDCNGPFHSLMQKDAKRAVTRSDQKLVDDMLSIEPSLDLSLLHEPAEAKEEAALRPDLLSMRKSELAKHAKVVGVAEQAIDDALDADDTKLALLKLITDLEVNVESNANVSTIASSSTNETDMPETNTSFTVNLADASPPFKGSDDPYKDRDTFDKDFIKDDDGPRREHSEREQHEVSKPRREHYVEEEENEIRKHGIALSLVIPVASVVFVVFTISNLMEKFGLAAAIPESLIMILIGAILGFFLKNDAAWEFFGSEERYTEVMSGILNLVLLPIIMFASGWALRRLDFFSQFPYILLFAVVGVGLSTCVVAGLIFLTGMLNLHGVTTGRTAFAYAALISATDPVATLSTYSKLKVDPLLNILVFGESIINDAVAIVLFDVFNSDSFMLKPSGQAMTGFGLLWNVCFGICQKFITSVLFGFFLGIVYTSIAHWADMRENKKGQILVILASCYLTYALAEVCGMSGIIAEIFCALLMGVYMRPLLSTEGSLLATFFVQQLAMLADACVFLLVGVSVNQLTYNGWYFGLWVMVFCLIGRFCAVYPLAFVTNKMKMTVGRVNNVQREGWNLLSQQHIFMMFHAGLRGAIALSLSLELGSWVDDIDGAGTRRALQTATFLVILTFLIVFGGSTQACLRALGISMGRDMPANALSKTEFYGGMRGTSKWLDKVFLTPLLVGHSWKADDKGEEDAEDAIRTWSEVADTNAANPHRR
jgi:sodium/hydrogen exchanger 8